MHSVLKVIPRISSSASRSETLNTNSNVTGVDQHHHFDVLFSTGLSDGGELLAKWVSLSSSSAARTLELMRLLHHSICLLLMIGGLGFKPKTMVQCRGSLTSGAARASLRHG